MINRSIINLDCGDGTISTAMIRTDLTQSDLVRSDNLWYPVKFEMESQARRAGIRFYEYFQHKHWVWNDMWATQGEIAYYVGIQVGDEIQGLMILRTDRVCQYSTQQGLPLVYVDRIASAPWNNASLLKELAQTPRYKGVGACLIQTAIDISRENGWDGRIGLHSLRQAEDFYRKRCGMLEFRPDSTHEYLKYFEMTPEIASAFQS